jgi:Methylmalonic aciduria and homocystinuria type D protein
MQCSLHPPSRFIQTHREQLLPDWSQPVRSLLLVLQPTAIPLVPQTAATEAHKQALRQRFLDFGQGLVHQLRQQGHLADLFDPATGLPLTSRSGCYPLDDVAVVSACLGYNTAIVANCHLLIHPTWGQAVYPATVVSSATATTMAAVIETWAKKCQFP